MQLTLDVLSPADPAVDTWKQLDPEAKKAFLEALARAIAKAVSPDLFERTEADHDR